jgi:tetratricopeptide (TPR) repeat protein
MRIGTPSFIHWGTLGAALFLLSSSAGAANRESKERAAKRACLNGDVTKGLKILTDLYIESKDPTYLYNQGRCNEQNNRYEEALGKFREYLRKVDISSDVYKADAQSAEQHIADCEALLGRKVADPAAAPMANPVATPVAPPPPVAAVQPAPPPATVVIRQPPSASTVTPSCTLCKVGIATAAVGGAALVTGLVLDLKANSMIGDIESHYSSSTYASAKNYKTISQVGYGAGAALVIGGAVLYYLGASSSQTTVFPTAGNTHAGVALQGAF